MFYASLTHSLVPRLQLVNNSFMVHGFTRMDAETLTEVCVRYGRQFVVMHTPGEETLQFRFPETTIDAPAPVVVPINTESADTFAQSVTAGWGWTSTDKMIINDTVTIRFKVATEIQMSTCLQILTSPSIACIRLFKGGCDITYALQTSVKSSLYYTKKYHPQKLKPVTTQPGWHKPATKSTGKHRTQAQRYKSVYRKFVTSSTD
jgi:hypothetical protein